MVQNEHSEENTQSDDRIDDARRRFLLKATGVLGGVGAVCALTPFVSSLLPNAKTRLLGGPVQVDVSELKPGQQIMVLWRGKPVWVIRRTQAMLEALDEPNSELRDPSSHAPQQPPYATNTYRSIQPEYLVLVGLCTHLGCVPLYEPKGQVHRQVEDAGFYCPCHGSRFDLAGRVFKHMPAPVNLEVPPYRFISPSIIEIGEASHG